MRGPYTRGVADPQPTPGWYPDPNGMLRWWDGAQWGQLAPTPVRPGAANTKTLAVLAHLGSVFGGFILPLVIYLTSKDDPYVKHHAAEGLNFQLTLMAVILGVLVLFFGVSVIGAGTASTGSSGAATGALVGGFIVLWVGIMVVSFGGIALGVVGAVKASKGEWWRYPVNIRLVGGAAPKDTPPIWI